ncbi:MAG: hypothetical protein Q9228_006362 [Teloschistes exilis]
MLLDLTLLRNADAKDLAGYYIQLRDLQDHDQITKNLLQEIGNESLPPTVFGIWLSVSCSDIALSQALHYPNSCLVRRFAIKRLGRRMRTSSWETVWNCLHGTQGVLDLFAQLSVVDVAHLSTFIGHCRKGRHRPARDASIEALLRGLLPFFHQESQPRSTDQRPLVNHYARMLPACSPGFVEQVLSQPDNPLLPYFNTSQILRYHPTVVQKRVLLATASASTDERFLSCLPQLARSVPSGQRDSAGFSPSMLYASDILAKLTGNQSVHVDSRVVINDVAAPLLDRAMKHRSNTDKVPEIVLATLSYLQHIPKATRYLDSKPRSILPNLARFWSRHGAEANDAVSRLLARCLEQYADQAIYTSTKSLVDDLLQNVARKHRYTLLLLVSKHFHRPAVDIDDLQPFHLMLDDYACQMFIDLDNNSALQLLSRITQAKRATDFLELGRRNSIFSHPHAPFRRADKRLLEIYLSRPESDGLASVKEDICELQRKSSGSRKQSDRAFFAKSAMFYAIGSGSLELYGDVLTWSWRYIKDPMTIRTIYDRQSLLTNQGIELLSGMQITTSGLPSHQPDTWRVAEANKILLNLFDIACVASVEPSFRQNDWSAIKAIYRFVIKTRLDSTRILQRRFGLPDDTLYDHVWQDTLTTLLNLEERACKVEHEILAFNSPYGPLGQDRLLVDGTDRPIKHPESSYRFLDELAKARDTLWKKIRPTSHPAAASLPRPWPQGLPIQFLANPDDIARQDAEGRTPFLSSRATSVVFLGAEAALSDLPPTDDDRAAIGSLVDDYGTALAINIVQQPQGPTRDRQVSRAWHHAITSLTGDRMDATEAIAFWRPIFRQALPRVKLEVPDVIDERRQVPVLPTDIDDGETNEWDPALNQRPGVKPRYLSIRAIDCLLHSSAMQLDPSMAIREPQARTQSFTPLSLWNTEDCLNESNRVQEGLIASTLLYIDSKENKSCRILRQPFPSGGDIRYPSLILDSEFLLRSELHISQAINVLEQLVNRVPSTLFRELTSSLLETSSWLAMESRETATATTTAYRLLALTKECDCPETIASLVLRTVLDRPEASSWHRQFLLPTFLNRLRPSHAKELLTSFAEAIELKNGLQSDTKILTKDTPNSVVKVTTIKYLAQLLHQSCYITSEDAFSILVSLLGKHTHIDVLVTIVESLLAMLAHHASHNNRSFVQKILIALQGLVPIAGRLNERKEDEKEPWDSMPVIEDEDHCPPIFDLLLDFAFDCEVDVGVRQDLVEQVLLPAFDATLKTHEKWIETFLARTKGGSAIEEYITPIPPRPTVLATLLEAIPAFLPGSYFDLWQRYTVMSLAPSPALVTFNRILRDGPGDDKGETDAVPSPDEEAARHHWLQIYDCRTEVFSECRLADVIIGDLPVSLAPSKNIQSILQGYTLEVARVMIQHFDELHESWERFLAPLHAPWGARQGRVWYEYCHPVIKGIIECVETYRDDASWRANKQRRPEFLPNMVQLRLMLLRPIPDDLPAAQPKDQHCAELADKLVELLTDIVANTKVYHDAMKQIVDYMTGNLRFPWNVDAACRTGDLASQKNEEECATIDYLKVEVAHVVFRQKAENIRESPEMMKKVEGLFEQWRDSEVEDFRMRGIVGLGQAQDSDLLTHLEFDGSCD